MACHIPLPRVIAIDFDKTIAHTTFPVSIDRPVVGAFEVIRELYSFDNELILWTCRQGVALLDAKNWLRQHDMLRFFGSVNENNLALCAAYRNDSRKIGAQVYIGDDAAGIPMYNGVVDWQLIRPWLCRNGYLPI